MNSPEQTIACHVRVDINPSCEDMRQVAQEFKDVTKEI